jgi:hypothetical protein
MLSQYNKPFNKGSLRKLSRCAGQNRVAGTYGKNWVMGTRKLLEPHRFRRHDLKYIHFNIKHLLSVWVADVASSHSRWVTTRVYRRVFKSSSVRPIRELVFTVFCAVCTAFCIVSFMYIYSYLFCLYYWKDYTQRVATQLQLIIIIIIIIIIPRKHSIDSLQKKAILGTSHTIRKVLQCEAWSVSGGDHCWFERSTGKKCLWQWHPYRIMMMMMIITFDRFTTKDSYTRNITHNTKVLQCEVWSLSDGYHRWFERSTRKKRPVTRDTHINIIIIIIIIIITLLNPTDGPG